MTLRGTGLVAAALAGYWRVKCILRKGNIAMSERLIYLDQWASVQLARANDGMESKPDAPW